MKDFTFDEFNKIEFIRTKFLETARIFGFKLMEPSTIELLSVLEAKSGSSIREEIYNFHDKGDREIALRFDFTVGLTRFISSQKTMKLPAKISSFGGVWRYDEPQKGRYRFFHQWDLEIYGKLTLDSDAEIIEFTSRFFENLKLQNIIINISHRKLVESFINKIFQSSDSNVMTDMLRAIDKIQKKSKSDILTEFEKKGYAEDKLKQILDFSEIKGSPNEISSMLNVTDLDGWNDLMQLYESLNARGVNNIQINFGIVRGLDYYSGIVFEAFDGSSDLGSLVGGGRYDNLPSTFGRTDIGATGVAGGVERIILTLDEQGILNTSDETRVSVLYANDDVKKDAINITSKLRQLRIPVDIDLNGRSLKKQMENSLNSKFVVIVAPSEISQGNIILKNMLKRTEEDISLTKLYSNASSFFNS